MRANMLSCVADLPATSLLFCTKILKRSIKLVPNADNIICLPFVFCIQCGTENSVRQYTFEETENNPISDFAKLAGEVSFFVENALNKPHKVQAKFCRRCIGKFENVAKMQQIFMLIGVVAVFLGVVGSTIIHSYFGSPISIVPFAISIVFLVGMRAYSRFYKWRNSPNITKVNKRKLIIKIPGQGKFVCER